MFRGFFGRPAIQLDGDEILGRAGRPKKPQGEENRGGSLRRQVVSVYGDFSGRWYALIFSVSKQGRGPE